MEESHKDGGKSKKSKGDVSKAKRIIALAHQKGIVLFHDEKSRPFARIPVGGHMEIWPCQGDRFRDWLASLLWKHEGTAAGPEAVSSALSVLRAQATIDGAEFPLYNRVARVDGEIWYDLADPQWRAVRISSGRWEVVEKPPILFRRFIHQKAQELSLADRADLTDLLGFLNVSDRSDALLLLVWLVSCFIPDIPHPVLVLHGPQGSAKTTALRIAKKLVDPSVAEVLTLGSEVKELAQQLDHNWAAFLDNLSSVPTWVSDALCRAVTGEGFTKRQLYSDEGDIVFSYRRCVAMSGINVVAYQPDLLDRSILIGLDRIGEGNYRAEEDLWAEFERMRPSLVSAMFGVLARALAIVDSIRLTQSPRMADFATWGCAIAVALGWSQEEFEAAYGRNAKLRTDEVLANDVVAGAIVQLMESEKTWAGTASELLDVLERRAEEFHINTRAKGWPSNGSVLSKRLKVAEADLAAAGIQVKWDRESRRREIQIAKIPTTDLSGPHMGIPCDTSDGSENLLSSAEASNHAGYDGSDGNDGRFTALEDKERKESIYTPPREAKSPVIGVTPVMPVLTPSTTTDCVTSGCDGSSDTNGIGGSVPSQLGQEVLRICRRRKLPLEVSDWPPDWRDRFEERAAISEFEDGRGRACAEIFAELRLRDLFERENDGGNGGDSACGRS